MIALILAAGYATRLYPLTKDTPKPLLKIKGRPIIDYIIDKIERIRDIERIYIVSNNKFHDQFEEWLQPKSKLRPGRYRLINDGSNSVEDRLGAIGDISFAIEKERFNDDLLVVGGDNLFGFDLRDFTRFGEDKKPFNSLCLYEHTNNHLDLTQFGIVELNDSSQVIGFEEKPAYPKTNIIGTCIYFMSKERLTLINRYLQLGNYCDTPGSYIKWLVDNDIVYAKAFKEAWFDLGDFDALTEAVLQLNGHNNL